MDSPDTARPARDDAVSPRQTILPVDRAMQHALRNINNPLNSHTLDMRADPDAQATVTDFLDFTEYLPSDMMRSLTLIGNLDQTYVDASTSLDDLTSQWGQLPTMSPADRPRPAELRAQISEKLNQTVSSRVYAHAEAVRMSENLSRHYNRIKVILSKLETMLENYPDESEIKSPVATAKSPQTSGTQRLALRMDGQRVRRPHVPRITIPGEVLAPYELNYDAFSSEEDISEGDEEDEQDERAPANRTTPDGPPRIKLIKSTSRPPKPSKVPKPRTSVPPPQVPGGHIISTSTALAQLKPPPENVVIGSSDAPWGQLTPYELAKLRKRMKKNVSWTPSDTMVARELFTLKRGVDAFNVAKQKAEEEGTQFEGKLPVATVDPVTGEERMPLGSLSLETLADEKNLSNRGMKLNEAKKLKREMLAKMAAEEAEESAKTFKLIAQTLMNGGSHNSHASQAKPLENKTPVGKTKPPPKKRKRDSAPEADAEKPELADGQAQRPQFKRTKTETPVPPPQLSASTSQVAHETPVQPPQRPVVHSTTPIPLPVHAQDQSITAKSGTSVASATSPAPSSNAGAGAGLPAAANTTLVPLKLPGAETPIPPPQHSPKKMTPIYPPVRETRKTQATRVQEQQQETGTAPLSIKPVSRGASPASLTPKADPDNQSTASGPTATTTPNGAPAGTTPSATTTTIITRRPASRGKAGSQEPVSSLASERQRRTSTARNTPAPEPRPSSRRSKRPPPGAISRTVSGGNSAVGKRKAAPKKKSRGKASKDSKVSADAEEDVEIDDEGNVIDPSEPRYCTCNGVSYGTMIQCDNVENCKHEWFHIDCVGLSDLPARTTKWYCPDCRVLLNIGEKGEVSARGVKA